LPVGQVMTPDSQGIINLSTLAHRSNPPGGMSRSDFSRARNYQPY
jgi:hypothetical protein